MRNYIFLAIFLLLFTGCQQQPATLSAVEIDYLHVNNLEEGHWIEIDGVRFEHVKAFEDVKERLFTLPASQITRAADMRQTEFTEPMASINIAIMLAGYLHNINVADNLHVSHDYTYQVINTPLLHNLGKLQFIRTDSSDIEISYSIDYPAKVSIIEIDD